MFYVDWKKLRAGSLATALALGATVALVPVSPAVAQVRALPDFTDLVEQVGPSVVNIRTVERARAGAQAPGAMDEEMQE
ncbi:MAG: serine peptidase, partial [Ramlibacter sp.]